MLINMGCGSYSGG